VSAMKRKLANLEYLIESNIVFVICLQETIAAE